MNKCKCKDCKYFDQKERRCLAGDFKVNLAVSFVTDDFQEMFYSDDICIQCGQDRIDCKCDINKELNKYFEIIIDKDFGCIHWEQKDEQK